MDAVNIIDMKTQKLETDASAASKDLQVVKSKIALNYRVRPDNIAWLRQNIGLDYKSKIVEPAIQEAVKASTSQFTAEELITNRSLVRERMKEAMQLKLNLLSNYSISIEEFNIVDFDFSEEFNKAIEAKVTAEQQALKAKNDLERIKIEAQQNVETAKGEAEARITKAKAEAMSIQIQSEALKTYGDQIIKLRTIEKWQGAVPTYLGCGQDSFILNLFREGNSSGA
jgi:regulator of protease activity HflC (stomatin/prohibitin superfamily)